MGRQPCCDKLGVKKGPWTAEEDKKLVTFILTYGHCCWRAVPKLAGLRRCGKSCRLRWTNYLRPDLKRGLLDDAEEQLIINLHARLGNRWSKIAAKLPGRTDNEIKNHWNTHIKKKLIKMGIDPVTHKALEKQETEVRSSLSSTISGLTEADYNTNQKLLLDDDDDEGLGRQYMMWMEGQIDQNDSSSSSSSSWSWSWFNNMGTWGNQNYSDFAEDSLNRLLDYYKELGDEDFDNLGSLGDFNKQFVGIAQNNS